MVSFRSVVHRAVTLAAVIVMALGLMRPAAADELQDVSKLVAAGRLIEAQDRADAYLQKTPKDAQMRFLKGVILAQRGERDAAVAVFTGLTQDFPELPEPYNNLAVISAAKGQYDDARAALETAIRVAPNDATAYENLGDIYAALAARAYRDAQRHDTRNTSAARKLDVVKNMLTAPAGTATTPAAANAPTASTGSTAAAGVTRSQRNIGLPSPAGFPSLTSGVLAEAPEVVMPAGATVAPAGAKVVGIETAGASDTPTSTATLAGARTTIAAAPADATPVAQITAVVQSWATTRSLTTRELSIRVDGDAAIARFQATDTSARKPVPGDRSLTLHRVGETWTVTDEGPRL